MLRIKELRLNKRLSTRALAKLAGLPYSATYDIENHRKLPRQDELEKLAAALGVTVDEIYKR